MAENHYQRLGVRNDATREQIVAAAKRQNAELKTVLAVLTDPAKRKAYDAELAQATMPKKPAMAKSYRLGTALIVPPLLLILVLAAGAWAVPVLWADNPQEIPLVRMILLGGSALAGLWLLASGLRVWRTRLRLGTENLSLVRGGKTVDLPLYRVKTLEVQRSLWGKLSNTGTLRIRDSDDEFMEIKGLAAPLQFQQHYYQMRESFDSGMWTGHRPADSKPDAGKPRHPSMLTKVRYLGMIEGVSYLLLLGVAMPLKYYAGMPQAVFTVGSVHGILFVLYLVYLIAGKITVPLPLWVMLTGIVAAITPFGPFFLDRKLKQYEPA